MAAALSHCFADAAAPWAWRDIAALAKVRLSGLVLATTGVGLWVAPGGIGPLRALATLLASAATVAAANALNSYMERDSDALMQRTRLRPLPAGRLDPQVALWLGLGGGALALVALYLAGGPLCALLAFAAYASYVWLYTPMKRFSWLAVLVGAIPGAIPPLMGYAAVTGNLGGGAWALFALMSAWQLPHFFAISIYLRHDYAQGGLKVLPGEVGVAATRGWIVATAAALVPVSLLPAWWGDAGAGYAAFALLSGGAFLGLATAGLGDRHVDAWARRVFVSSVLHLSALLLVLAAGASP